MSILVLCYWYTRYIIINWFFMASYDLYASVLPRCSLETPGRRPHGQDRGAGYSSRGAQFRFGSSCPTLKFSKNFLHICLVILVQMSGPCNLFMPVVAQGSSPLYPWFSRCRRGFLWIPHWLSLC